MDCLHGGDDTERTEARYINRVDVLRVLNAPSKVLAVNLHRRPRPLIEIEHFAYAAITNRMRVDLKSMLDRDFGCALDIFDGFEHQAGCVSQVLVWFQQPGAVCAQRTIDLSLDGTNRQEVVSLRQHFVLWQHFVHYIVRNASHHHVKSDGQVALFLELPQKVDTFQRSASILE